MRLAQLNRLKLVAVSSAVAGALLSGYGCRAPQKTFVNHAPPIGQNAGMSTMPTTDASTQPATEATTGPTTGPTIPTTAPATLPATMPATIPGTDTAVTPPPVTPTVPVVVPATMPATVPSTQATTQPTTQPATQPTTQPAEPPIQNADRPSDPKIIDSDKALAEQFASELELEFNRKITNKDEWPLILKHQAAVLAAAAELDPNEGRYGRLMADAMREAHDVQGEKDALYRAIIADNSDEFSWNRSLDLHLADIPDLKDKLAYLQEIIDRTGGTPVVPVDVKAHACYQKALLQIDAGEDDAVDATLEDALKLCAASLECLKLKFNLLLQKPDATITQKCACLIALLKANPLQMEYSAELAQLLADNGLARESVSFYELCIATARQLGQAAPHQRLNLAASLFLSDPKGQDAYDINTALLKIDPTFTPAYFLELIITKHNNDKDAYTKTLTEAGNALGNHVIDAMNSIAPTDANKATTRPINDPDPLSIPDLSATVAQLKLNGTPEQKARFCEAVADMALLEGYFAHQPDAAAKLIDALGGVLPENDPELVRLRGWNDFLSGKMDDARARFLSVSAQDPLAQLGLVCVMRGNPQEKQSAEQIARKLLHEHRAGLLGALLMEELRADAVKMVPASQEAAMQQMAIDFPDALVAAPLNTAGLYTVHVTPELVGTRVGEPLLARVTIDNVSDSDLTIGPDGLLKPELLFKLTPQVGQNAADRPSFDAFDFISGPTVLPSHHQMHQLVRMDQTQLLSFLNSHTQEMMVISGNAQTNHVTGGVAGVEVPFTKTYYRYSTVANGIDEQKTVDDLTTGRAEQKVPALDRLVLFVELYRAAANHPANGGPAPDPKYLIQQIHKARLNPLPAVSAWASKCEFDIDLDPVDQADILRDLAQDTDWRHRQVALLLVVYAPPALRDSIIDGLVNDPQYSVRGEARALKARFALPHATAPNPATMPTAAPATPPVGTPVAPPAGTP
jgi:hypothetical protein